MKFILLKNPWSHTRWKGPYSPYDFFHWTVELSEALNTDLFEQAVDDKGLFWINWDSVLVYFPGLYINWNPELFSKHLIIHDEYKPKMPNCVDRYTMGYNPQYILEYKPEELKESETVYILISKHMNKRRDPSDPSRLYSLHVYNDTLLDRIYYPENAVVWSPYVDHPHLLVRLKLNPKKNRYILVVSQNDKSFDMDYTIQVYSHIEMTLTQIPYHLSKKMAVKGRWTKEESGGKYSYVIFNNI